MIDRSVEFVGMLFLFLFLYFRRRQSSAKRRERTHLRIFRLSWWSTPHFLAKCNRPRQSYWTLRWHWLTYNCIDGADWRTWCCRGHVNRMSSSDWYTFPARWISSGEVMKAFPNIFIVLQGKLGWNYTRNNVKLRPWLPTLLPTLKSCFLVRYK